MPTLEATVPQLQGAVRDVMTKEVLTVGPTERIEAAAALMTERHTNRVVVVDAQQRVVGVISQRDILRHYVQPADQAENFAAEPPAGDVQSLIHREKPVTILPDLPLAKAAAVLATNKIGCLPVVGTKRELIGVLTTTDLLRRVTGQRPEHLESSFQIYTPASIARVKLPAYIRKQTGELVVPLKCMDNRDVVTSLVVLGYDGKSGRILIKFVSQGTENEGAMRTRVEDDCLVISATSFVTHFDLIGKTSAFDVSVHKENKYVVLSPRQVT